MYGEGIMGKDLENKKIQNLYICEVLSETENETIYGKPIFIGEEGIINNPYAGEYEYVEGDPAEYINKRQVLDIIEENYSFFKSIGFGNSMFYMIAHMDGISKRREDNK